MKKEYRLVRVPVSMIDFIDTGTKKYNMKQGEFIKKCLEYCKRKTDDGEDIFTEDVFNDNVSLFINEPKTES